ncbi:MAG: TetR/AcrR family transcriptional regulator [Chloroflexi bacterium]|nr:MAG: TetR/AcrR family transcriptional regulator [Chloroflexota bacterium]
MARPGRRPGTTVTREAILDAARRRFAGTGYEQASIRAIAADAGVTPALVMHFFGSKEALFQAAVAWPFDPAELAAQMLSPGRDGLGVRLARAFLTLWDAPETSRPLLAVLRSAMNDEGFARLLMEFLVTRLFRHVADLIEGPDRELRVELCAGHLLGVAIMRHVLRAEPVASASIDQLVGRVGPVLEGYLQPPAH